MALSGVSGKSPLRVVPENKCIEDASHDLLLIGVQTRDGLVMRAHVVARPSLVSIEEKLLSAYAENAGHSSEDIERGLRGAGLVAAKLTDVNADLRGKIALGEPPVLAQDDEPLWKLHHADLLDVAPAGGAGRPVYHSLVARIRAVIKQPAATRVRTLTCLFSLPTRVGSPACMTSLDVRASLRQSQEETAAYAESNRRRIPTRG